MATQVELVTYLTSQPIESNGNQALERPSPTMVEAAPEASLPMNLPKLTKVRSVTIMATLAGVSFLNTFNSGLLTVALPRIAEDLSLPPGLLLWPASVYALTLGCTLLLFGAIADVVGNRPVFLTGTAFFTAFTLACSLAESGSHLIAFRALQGISMALCMPTSVSTITNTFPSGKMRNVAFAAFGGGSPLGFAVGLVLGGIFTETLGWRVGYYMAAGANAVIFAVACFTIPKVERTANVWQKLAKDLDWIGVAIVSICLASSSYVFANITYSTSTISEPQNISLVVVSTLLIPTFIFWMGRQEKRGRPAVIPNSIWRKTEFTSICISVFLTWAMFNAYSYWATLFFQVTQELSALQASLRFLPMVVVGATTNIVAGLLMDKVPAVILVLIGSVLSAAAPILFAVQDPSWSYWAAGFPAMVLSAISSDLLFNVSNLVITNSFPAKDQALAGGIFNTVTQLGNSIGLAVTAILASAVTVGNEGGNGISDELATLKGYRAALWICFAAAVVSCFFSALALRKSGKVGQKRD